MPEAYGNGIRLHYEVRGDGDPLVLLMGLGADGGFWEEHVRPLRRADAAHAGYDRGFRWRGERTGYDDRSAVARTRRQSGLLRE
jgi:pimeloyl-ACP methyl ester carboxylesterase